MKVSIKIKTATLVLTGLLAQSCGDDFLDKSNPNTINTASWGFTEPEVVNLVTAAYSPLNKDYGYGRWQQQTDNLRADEAYANALGEGRGDLDLFNTLTAATVPVRYMWQNFYTGVFRANFAMEQITEKAMKGSDADKVADELGETHFLRAYNYFWLVLNFKNVPLITETPANRDEFYPKQAQPEEVWTFIIDEFTKAKELLPDSWPNAQLGRATKGAAAACLGRAYLFRYNFYKNRDDLVQAKANFDEVYNSGKYSLRTSYFDNFSLEAEFNSESIFEIPFVTYTANRDYDPNKSNTIQGELRGQEFAPLRVPGTWGSVQPVQRAFDEFKDLTTTGQLDPRRDVTFHFNKPNERLYGRTYVSLYGATSDYVGWRKYQVSMYPDKYTAERVNNDWPPLNYREFRLADLMLLLAETENELGNTARATTLINLVRKRAGVVELAAGSLGQAALREQVIHERAVELCGEGKRWYDLLRWNLLEKYIKPANPGFTSGIHEYLPIPGEELTINPNLVQNNGY